VDLGIFLIYNWDQPSKYIRVMEFTVEVVFFIIVSVFVKLYKIESWISSIYLFEIV